MSGASLTTSGQHLVSQLPKIVYGKYRNVHDSDELANFPLGDYFPALVSDAIMEVCERDGMYFHIFTDPKNPNVTVREVPFTLGKTYEQPVKNNMLMDYTYLAYEGDRTSLNTVYKEKPSPARPETMLWGDFTVTRDFDEDGYVSTYVHGNYTAQRIYRRITG